MERANQCPRRRCWPNIIRSCPSWGTLGGRVICAGAGRLTPCHICAGTGLRANHRNDTNICIGLCAVQGLLLLSSEVIKCGFEQGSQEQVGSMELAACIMHHAPCSTQHAAHKRSPNHIAVGTSARQMRRLPRTLSDAPPRTPIADRRRVHSCRCALEALGAGSGRSGRRS